MISHRKSGPDGVYPLTGMVLIIVKPPLHHLTISSGRTRLRYPNGSTLNTRLPSYARLNGFEPLTLGFGIRCSTNWSYRRIYSSFRIVNLESHTMIVALYQVYRVWYHHLKVYLYCSQDRIRTCMINPILDAIMSCTHFPMLIYPANSVYHSATWLYYY